MKGAEAIVINGNQRNSAIPLENESRITLIIVPKLLKNSLF